MAETKEMKSGMTDQKKQAVIEQLWLSYYNDTLLTRPLSSRHFLWTPVMQHKHNGLPSGFVLS